LIPNFIKTALVKSYLNKLTELDHGTTVAGIVASALLGANLDIGKMLDSSNQLAQYVEIGKALGVVTFALVMWRVGKPKQPSPQ
jgi:hypothetical protein